MHWIFIGAGNMAASLAGGLITSGASSSTIALVDPDADARARLSEQIDVATAASLADLRDSKFGRAGDASVSVGYVIAVKPHIVEKACAAIADAIRADSDGASEGDPLVVSIAAGVRIAAIAAWLPAGTPIVRCMPNTPALLGLGASGLYANDDCSETQRHRADELLRAVGSTHWVDDEALLDAVTATSGSGPAYFFYLIEQMANAGAELGLDPNTARELAIDTAFGAASMARARDVTPDELRRRVTSRGGTTAAALTSFDAAGLPAIVSDAMRAAHTRAVELGDEFQPT